MEEGCSSVPTSLLVMSAVVNMSAFISELVQMRKLQVASRFLRRKEQTVDPTVDFFNLIYFSNYFVTLYCTSCVTVEVL